jgi:hypothetical protein
VRIKVDTTALLLFMASVFFTAAVLVSRYLFPMDQYILGVMITAMSASWGAFLKHLPGTGAIASPAPAATPAASAVVQPAAK